MSLSAAMPPSMLTINGYHYARVANAPEAAMPREANKRVAAEQPKAEKKPSWIGQAIRTAGAFAVAHFGTKWISQNTNWILNLFGPKHQQTGKMAIEAATTVLGLLA
ncbi:MAG: hypothetical protein VKK59_07685 [Vampirovibrionales bacterium]|nr:hypothetical protein [Vampirovibrionales bacterium]